MAGFFDQLHPRTAAWFRERFGAPTEAQELCVPRVVAGESVLLASPTGSGKTLAAFLGVLDGLLREQEAGQLPGQSIRAVYVSPLRALAYDIEKNLREPLRGLGLENFVRVGLRTGDTPAAERQRQRRHPPHVLVTTPESLAILLPQAGLREALAGCRHVIVDELHAFAGSKRGAHLALSLERLERLANPGRDPARRLCRTGLSATISPMEEAGRFLMGSGGPCHLAEAKAGREAIFEVLTPLRRDPYPPAGYTASRMIRDIARIVDGGASTLIFTNTRSGAERLSHRLKLALPGLADRIECHHSSLDRDLRQEVEDRLKEGALRAVACSTSLELGVDIGRVDTVVLVSTPKGVSRALQRVGRSGHSIGRRSHGVLVATNINDLVECVVCAEMARRGQLDPVAVFENPADVLAQHLVGMAMGGGFRADEAFDLVRGAWPFRRLEREEFDQVLRYLEGGGAALEGQYQEVFGKIIRAEDGRHVTPSRRVERDYLLNVGTIHADGMVSVTLGRRRLGSVEESFAKGLKEGDIFILGGRTLRLAGSGPGELKVEAAAGRLPTVPTWNAQKMPLASGLAGETARLRGELDRRLEAAGGQPGDEILDWLAETWNVSRSNAAAIAEHFRCQRAISVVPTDRRMVVEAWRDEEGDPDRIHYFFHSLIGRSANDALSRVISYRLKQAAGGNALVTVDDYGFLLSVRTFQALGSEEWRELFSARGAAEDLAAALEGSHLVKWQFSGLAQTGLMVPRNLPGEARRLRQVRWSADILFQVLSRHDPGHPLLRQAYREAAHVFLDLDRARAFMETAAGMEWRHVDVPAVSPFAFGIYASKIKESMMMESPEEAIERLHRAMQEKVAQRLG